MLVYLFIKTTYLTSYITTFAALTGYIFLYIFQITSELKEVYYSKRPKLSENAKFNWL